jgi:hypothetical protein
MFINVSLIVCATCFLIAKNAITVIEEANMVLTRMPVKSDLQWKWSAADDWPRQHRVGPAEFASMPRAVVPGPAVLLHTQSLWKYETMAEVSMSLPTSLFNTGVTTLAFAGFSNQLSLGAQTRHG